MTFPRYNGRQFEDAITFDMRDEYGGMAYSRLLDTLTSWYSEAVENDDVIANEESGFRHFRVEEIEVMCDLAQASKRSRIVFLTILHRNREMEENDEYPYSKRDDNLFVQCVLCGETFGFDEGARMDAANARHGPVYDVDTGKKFEEVGLSDGNEPLACESCYEQHQTAMKAQSHRTLDTFADGDGGEYRDDE